MLRRWIISALLIYCALQLTGCGEPPPCDDICAAKHQQELQAVELETQNQAEIAPLIMGANRVYAVSIPATLFVFVFEIAVYAWRKHVYQHYSPDERWQAESDERIAIAAADSQRQLPPISNYYARPAAIDGEFHTIDEPLQLPPAMPVAPSWQQLQASGFVADPARFIVAYSSKGAETVDLNGNSSVAVIGRSGQGKTTALRLYLWQAKSFGGVVVFDPHGAIIPHGGMARVASANSNIAGEMDSLATKLNDELIRRLTLYAGGQRTFTPLTTFADELPTLSQMSVATINILGRIVLEGRKVAMYIILAGQGIPAAILEAANGGRRIAGSLYRDSFTVRVAFSASERMASMVGFSGDETRLIDELGDQPGKCYIEGPMRLTFCAMPLVKNTDLASPMQLPAPHPVADTAKLPVTSAPATLGSDEIDVGSDIGSEGSDNTTSAETMLRKRVADGWKRGLTASQIVEELWGVTGGRAYAPAANELARITASLMPSDMYTD